MSFILYMFSISIRELLPLSWDIMLQSLLVLVIGFSILLVCSLLFAKVFFELNDDDNNFLMEQREESNQYKRMVNSIDECMIVLHQGRVNFSNRMASKILNNASFDL